MSETNVAAKIHGYVHEPKLTPNLEAYREWVMELGEPASALKGKTARDAFLLGLYVGLKGYSHYQTSKPTSKAKAASPAPAAPAAPAKAAARSKMGTRPGGDEGAMQADAAKPAPKRAPRKAAKAA